MRHPAGSIVDLQALDKRGNLTKPEVSYPENSVFNRLEEMRSMQEICINLRTGLLT